MGFSAGAFCFALAVVRWCLGFANIIVLMVRFVVFTCICGRLWAWEKKYTLFPAIMFACFPHAFAGGCEHGLFLLPGAHFTMTFEHYLHARAGVCGVRAKKTPCFPQYCFAQFCHAPAGNYGRGRKQLYAADPSCSCAEELGAQHEESCHADQCRGECKFYSRAI